MGNNFFVFEGCDGCGKTTQLNMAFEELESKGYKVKKLKAPGSGINGAALRNMLLNPKYNISAKEELLLYCAANVEVGQEVEKYLSEGYIVLLDRYMLSTAGYQTLNLLDNGYSYKNIINVISTLCDFSQIAKAPVNIVYDIKPETALQRIRSQSQDRIESRDDKFFKNICKYYSRDAMDKEMNISRVDANRSIEEIHADTMKIIYKKIS